MNETIMVDYRSRESPLQRGMNFIGECPYVGYCPVAESARESRDDSGRDFYEEVCSVGGRCLTHGAFDEALQTAINDNGLSYSFNHPIDVTRLSQITLARRFDEDSIYAFIVSEDPSLSRLFMGSTDLFNLRRKLPKKLMEDGIVIVRGPINLENLGEQDGA